MKVKKKKEELKGLGEQSLKIHWSIISIIIYWMGMKEEGLQ